MKKNKGDVLVLQTSKKDKKIYMDVSTDDILKILNEKSPCIASRFKETNKQIKYINSHILRNPDKLIEYYEILRSQAKTDKHINTILADKNKTAIEQIDEYHKYTSLGSVILFDRKQLRGQAKFFSSTWPNLTWWPKKFNDRATSIFGWGGEYSFRTFLVSRS